MLYSTDMLKNVLERGGVTLRIFRPTHEGRPCLGGAMSLYFFNKDDNELGSYCIAMKPYSRLVMHDKPILWGEGIKQSPDLSAPITITEILGEAHA